MTSRRKRNGTSPTLLAFGNQLKRLRNGADLSQERLAHHLGVTGQYVYLVEKGQTRCRREFASEADRFLNADGALVQYWLDLVMDAAYPTWFDWPSVEVEAAEIVSYSVNVVDGLFQTPGYASALLSGNKEAIEARLNRQHILSRSDPPPPEYTLLLDEAALVREVGSPQIMREQLEHLLDRAADLSEIMTLQVVPARGDHNGNSGSFKVATLEDRAQIAYVESAARGLTMHEPEDLATLVNYPDNIVWRKASRSTSNGGDCVELATLPHTIAIRDSKDPHGPKLHLHPHQFHTLATTIKAR